MAIIRAPFLNALGTLKGMVGESTAEREVEHQMARNERLSAFFDQRTPFNQAFGEQRPYRFFGQAGACRAPLEYHTTLKTLTAMEKKPYVHLRDRKAPPWPIDWWK